jgi:hypothetical protein
VVDRHAEYDARLERWRDRLATIVFTEAQADGWACVACGHNQFTDPDPRSFVPVGFGPIGQVFVCVTCDEQDQEKTMGSPDDIGEFLAAREKLVRAVIRYLSAERDEESAHAAWEVEYAGELVGLAARRLVRAIENGPDDIKPVGWGDVEGSAA